ncbi:MAG: phosphotransferase [Anaerolineaceae bacterium]|nr:phosphotransferase [Anaerolineaceae bacterium]
MSNDMLITSVEQVNELWLTHILEASGALYQGRVTKVDMLIDARELSTSVRLGITYSEDATGSKPTKLFLKLVTLDMEDEFFGPSEVNYYQRDYVGIHDAPIPRTYDAVYSEKQGRYHILMDDLSDTHMTARDRMPTLGYGMALAESLATLHAHWWGKIRLSEIDEHIPDAQAIQEFTDMGKLGASFIIATCEDELKAHWPEVINRIYVSHPHLMVQRTQDDVGFTLIHGDMNRNNILVPINGERPLYLIDRQPFNWSLTVWLAVYDLAYAMVLYWDVKIRRALETHVLRHYHKCLIRQGITAYTWEQLWDDYRLCAMMGVYVATEWCRSQLNMDTHQYWMPMLQRTLTAVDDLQAANLL